MNALRMTLLASLLATGCYTGLNSTGAAIDTDDDDASSVGSTGSDSGDSSPSGDDSGEGERCEGACTGASPMQLMRRNQVIGVMRQAFGSAADAVPFSLVPADTAAGLFSSNHLPADATRVEAYHAFAERAAVELVSEIGCEDEACVEAELRRILPVLFKRDPLEDEVQAHLALMSAPAGWDGAAWATDEGFAQALSLALQSPQFLYRIEVGEPTEDPRVRRLTGAEMATRLALVLWNESPSPALRAVAAQGGLDTSDGVASTAREMLADPRAEAMVLDFFEAYLGTQRFGDHGRYLEGSAVADDYPGLPAVTADMQAELEAFVTHVMRNGASVRELFAADYSFGSEALAAYYGVPTSAPLDGGLYRLELSGRAGLLSLGAVVGSHTTVEAYRTAHRGSFVARNVLCIELPPPPADIVIPPIPDGVPPREAFEQMTDSPTCAGCHEIINPLGFAFENLDGGGRFAEVYPEFDSPIDARGLLPSGEEIDGVAELGVALAEDPQAQRCMARRWFEYTLERTPTEDDARHIDAAHRTLVESAFDLRELIVALLASDAGRVRVLPGE